ncbi:hypothetical protein [Streptomyces sp. MUM 16J]|uniref:hypothetical protein n=1 Tax=Streptomyces sp. MUM 16J TaxID=2791988 RepID=UPI001F050151|nr:hypothetical protein [Streptomyces sp. MUM 16J]MCH0558903.1 hypothetical protein [Streptomyces sp. MUM 16J]
MAIATNQGVPSGADSASLVLSPTIPAEAEGINGTAIVALVLTPHRTPHPASHDGRSAAC